MTPKKDLKMKHLFWSCDVACNRSKNSFLSSNEPFTFTILVSITLLASNLGQCFHCIDGKKGVFGINGIHH